MSNNQLDDNLKAAACEIWAKNGNSSKPCSMDVVYEYKQKLCIFFSTQNAKKDFFEFWVSPRNAKETISDTLC